MAGGGDVAGLPDNFGKSREPDQPLLEQGTIPLEGWGDMGKRR